MKGSLKLKNEFNPTKKAPAKTEAQYFQYNLKLF